MAETDKMPLVDFVSGVADQFLKAAQNIEAAHPDWKVGSVELVTRVALKPIIDNGVTTIFADVDEPERMLHELTIPLIRKEP